MNDDPPVIDAHRDGPHLVFHCPHCKHDHRHGACQQLPGCTRATRPDPFGELDCTCPPGTGNGHRSAHCTTRSGSPYRTSGYTLRETTN